MRGHKPETAETTVEAEPAIKVALIRRNLMVYAVVFVLWGLYRLLIRFPIFLEEAVLKPLVFFPPALAMLEREKVKKTAVRKIFGWQKEGIPLAVYFGLTIGMTYFLIVAALGLLVSGWGSINLSGIGQSQWLSLLLVALASAVWEQAFFNGFLLLRFEQALRNQWSSVGLTASLFALLHLPILLVDTQISQVWQAVELGLLWLVGCINAVLMLRTRNILGPILAYIFLALAFQLVG